MSDKMKAVEKIAVSPPTHAFGFSRPAVSVGQRESGGGMSLPQAAGNLAMQRWLRAGAIQAKLAVSQPGDPYEQEADRIAEQVTAPDSLGEVQRKCAACAVGAPCSTCGDGLLQTKAQLGHTPHLPSGLQSSLASLRGGGQPLPTSVRAFFEPRLGTDLSQVRIHTGEQAAASARLIQARAYTAGQDVVFGAGAYAPESLEGRKLLAHELTHTVQQGQAGGLVPSAVGLDSKRGHKGSERSPTPTLPLIQRQLVTPLAPGGGFGGVMDRDRQRLTDAPKQPPGKALAPLGDVVVSLGSREIFGRREMKPKEWSKSTGQITLAEVPIPIPDLPMLAEFYGEAGVSARLSAGFGPARLENLQVGVGYLDAASLVTQGPLALPFLTAKGRAQLSLPAHITANFTASGALGAAASVVTVKIARVEGRLTADASAGANALFGGLIDLNYEHGVLSFYHAERLAIDIELSFSLNAKFLAEILKFQWTKTWNLIDWRRMWRLEAGVNLSYINGVRELNINQEGSEDLSFKTILKQLFESAPAQPSTVAPVDPKQPHKEDPYAKSSTEEQPTNEKEAAKVGVGDWLDIAHSRFATGWAGRAAQVSAVNPQADPPHVLYRGRPRPVGGIISGMGSFRTYDVAWRKQQDIGQVHHIASVYVFPAHKAFQTRGISIEAEENKVRLYGHAGSHSAVYHATVRTALDAAVANDDGVRSLQPEVIRALQGLRNQICAGTLRLYDDPLKDVWCE